MLLSVVDDSSITISNLNKTLQLASSLLHRAKQNAMRAATGSARPLSANTSTNTQMSEIASRPDHNTSTNINHDKNKIEFASISPPLSPLISLASSSPSRSIAVALPVAQKSSDTRSNASLYQQHARMSKPSIKADESFPILQNAISQFRNNLVKSSLNPTARPIPPFSRTLDRVYTQQDVEIDDKLDRIQQENIVDSVSSKPTKPEDKWVNESNIDMTPLSSSGKTEVPTKDVATETANSSIKRDNTKSISVLTSPSLFDPKYSLPLPVENSEIKPVFATIPSRDKENIIPERNYTNSNEIPVKPDFIDKVKEIEALEKVFIFIDSIYYYCKFITNFYVYGALNRVLLLLQICLIALRGSLRPYWHLKWDF